MEKLEEGLACMDTELLKKHLFSSTWRIYVAHKDSCDFTLDMLKSLLLIEPRVCVCKI